jgi:hypothetical protein
MTMMLKLACQPGASRCGRWFENEATHPVGREERRPRSRPGGVGLRSCVVGLENYGLPAESVKWHGGNNRGKDYREVAQLLSCQQGDADGDVEALASGADAVAGAAAAVEMLRDGASAVLVLLALLMVPLLVLVLVLCWCCRCC